VTAEPSDLERVAAFRSELRRFVLRTNSAAAEAGLSPQRYDLLLAIRSAGEVRVTELCDLLQLQQTAVTQLVKRTEEAGLVERRASAADGRVWLLQLTAAGEALVQRMVVAARGEVSELATALQQVGASLHDVS